MAGTGLTDVASTGTLNLSGNNGVQLYGVLETDGATNWSGGISIQMFNGTINNYGTWTVNSSSTVYVWSNTGGTTNSFNNGSSLRHQEGTGKPLSSTAPAWPSTTRDGERPQRTLSFFPAGAERAIQRQHGRHGRSAGTTASPRRRHQRFAQRIGCRRHEQRPRHDQHHRDADLRGRHVHRQRGGFRREHQRHRRYGEFQCRCHCDQRHNQQRHAGWLGQRDLRRHRRLDWGSDRGDGPDGRGQHGDAEPLRQQRRPALRRA